MSRPTPILPTFLNSKRASSDSLLEPSHTKDTSDTIIDTFVQIELSLVERIILPPTNISQTVQDESSEQSSPLPRQRTTHRTMRRQRNNEKLPQSGNVTRTPQRTPERISQREPRESLLHAPIASRTRPFATIRGVNLISRFLASTREDRDLDCLEELAGYSTDEE